MAPSRTKPTETRNPKSDLTPEIRAALLQGLKDGQTATQLSQQFSINRSTIYRTQKRFATHNTIETRPRPGRPQKHSPANANKKRTKGRPEPKTLTKTATTEARNPKSDLPPETRAALIQGLKDGQTPTQLSRQFSINRSTIYRTQKRFATHNTLETRPRSGRPHKLTPAEKRYVWLLARRRPYLSWRGLLANVESKISISTIRRIINKRNLRMKEEQAEIANGKNGRKKTEKARRKKKDKGRRGRKKKTA